MYATKKYHLVFLRSIRRLLAAACVVPSSPIFVTLMEAPGSSETSVLTRATLRNNPENTILHGGTSFAKYMGMHLSISCVFWYVVLYTRVDMYQYFGRTC
jgi:hypothetical protein